MVEKPKVRIRVKYVRDGDVRQLDGFYLYRATGDKDNISFLLARGNPAHDPTELTFVYASNCNLAAYTQDGNKGLAGLVEAMNIILDRREPVEPVLQKSSSTSGTSGYNCPKTGYDEGGRPVGARKARLERVS